MSNLQLEVVAELVDIFEATTVFNSNDYIPIKKINHKKFSIYNNIQLIKEHLSIMNIQLKEEQAKLNILNELLEGDNDSDFDDIDTNSTNNSDNNENYSE